MAGDTNKSSDSFVHDRLTGKTTRVSVDSAGVEGNGGSNGATPPALSSDGQIIVAFSSTASNLVAGDTNKIEDVFVHVFSPDNAVADAIDLSVVLSDTPDPVLVGNPLTLTGTVTNHGPIGAMGVELVLTIPDGTTFVSASPGCTQSGANVTCAIGDLAAGAQVSRSIVVSPTLVGNLTANASVTSNESDSNPANNQGSAVTLASTTKITRVSVDSNGNQGSYGGSGPRISADGRYVAFYSNSSNLAGSDTTLGLYPDIYLHDRQTGETSRISDDTAGARAYASGALSMSADGRFIGFLPLLSELLGCGKISQLVIRDRQSGENLCVSNPPIYVLSTFYSAISSDGRYIAFDSIASNLVADDTNDDSDIFLYDFQTNITSRVSVDSAGNQAAKSTIGSTHPAISADGRFVAFESWADNLVPGDVDGKPDVFVHDTQTGTTSLVSVSTDGIKGNSNSEQPSISADGRYVAFYSSAYNLVPGRSSNFSDVYVHDHQTHETTRVSVDSAGNLANGSSGGPSISPDGRYVAFTTEAKNLMVGDPLPRGGVFLHDRVTGETTCVSVDLSGTHCAYGAEPTVSADGEYVAFSSSDSKLVPDDTNGISDVFVYARGADTPTPDSVDLSVVLSDTPDPVIVGNPLSYTTLVTNHGPGAATGVQLNLKLPNGASFLSASPGCTQSGNDVTCAIGDVASGAQVTRTIVVGPTLAGGMSGVASVSGNEIDSNAANNQASVVSTVSTPSETQVTADLALTLAAPKSVKAGRKVVNFFTIKNRTKVLSPSVNVNCQLPETVTLLKKPDYCTATGSQLTCNLGTLGKKKSKRFAIKLATTAKGLITILGSVSSNAVSDPDLANNTVSRSTTVK